MVLTQFIAQLTVDQLERRCSEVFTLNLIVVQEKIKKYLFGCMECLSTYGVFGDIHVSFLPVGYMHADID